MNKSLTYGINIEHQIIKQPIQDEIFVSQLANTSSNSSAVLSISSPLIAGTDFFPVRMNSNFALSGCRPVTRMVSNTIVISALACRSP